jgi:small subunit ribosomal protein S2
MLLVYGGIINLKGSPGALFIIDPKRERTAVREAVITGVKTVALVDTNTDPSDIDFPIPANDDAIKSVALLVRTISSAVEEGYKEFEKTGKEAAEVKEAPEKTEGVVIVDEPKVNITIDESHIQKIEKDAEKIVVETKEKTVEKPISEEEVKEIKKRGRPKKGS